MKQKNKSELIDFNYFSTPNATYETLLCCTIRDIFGVEVKVLPIDFSLETA